MRILVLDIETTGFSPQKDAIVEIGLVSLDTVTGSRKIVFDELIREEAFAFNEEAEICKSWIFNNSDLKPEDVNLAWSFEIWRPVIQSWLNIFPVTAWNSSFDFSFLKDRHFEFKELPDPMKAATLTMKMRKKKGNGWKWPKVEEAYLWYMPVKYYEEKHRAAYDAWDEAAIISAMIWRGDYHV